MNVTAYAAFLFLHPKVAVKEQGRGRRCARRERESFVMAREVVDQIPAMKWCWTQTYVGRRTRIQPECASFRACGPHTAKGSLSCGAEWPMRKVWAPDPHATVVPSLKRTASVGLTDIVNRAIPMVWSSHPCQRHSGCRLFSPPDGYSFRHRRRQPRRSGFMRPDFGATVHARADGYPLPGPSRSGGVLALVTTPGGDVRRQRDRVPDRPQRIL